MVFIETNRPAARTGVTIERMETLDAGDGKIISIGNEGRWPVPRLL